MNLIATKNTQQKGTLFIEKKCTWECIILDLRLILSLPGLTTDLFFNHRPEGSTTISINTKNIYPEMVILSTNRQYGLF